MKIKTPITSVLLLTLLLSSPILSSFKCDMSPSYRADIADDGANFISPDPGCTDDKPARCQGDGANSTANCEKNYTLCMASSGCIEPARALRCTTGECVNNISDCPWDTENGRSFTPWCPKVEDSTTSFERCFDGFCRPKGACDCINYSGCKFGTVECPDGRCVANMSRCGAQGSCNISHPVSCGVGICVKNMSECGDRLTGAAFSSKTFKFAGVALSDAEEQEVDTVMLRNSVNFKTSITVRLKQMSFYPQDISPFYEEDKQKDIKVNWTPAKTTSHKSLKDSGRRLRNRSLLGKNKNRRLQATVDKKDKNDAQIPLPEFVKTDAYLETKYNSNDAPYDSLKQFYKLRELDQKAEMVLEYVTTEELKDVKNIIPLVDMHYIRAWFMIEMTKDQLPNYLSMLSPAVKISTTGRFDNNDRFLTPMEQEFNINNVELAVEWSNNRIEQELFLNTFNSSICLAITEPATKTWLCVNRKPISIIKPPVKSGKPNTLHSSITYAIDFPGTYAVIIKPIPNYSDSTEAFKSNLYVRATNAWTMPWKSEIIIFFTIFLLIVILAVYLSASYSGAKESRLTKRVSKFKWNLVMKTHPDYKGQGVLQKLEETVRFFDNPLRNTNQEEIDANLEANANFDTKLKAFAEQNHKKQGVQMKMQSNLKDIKETKMIMKGELKGSASSNDHQNDLYRKTYAHALKMSGNSLFGTKGVEIIEEEKQVQVQVGDGQEQFVFL